MTDNWQSVVYGGRKLEPGDGQASKNVQAPPDTAGSARSADGTNQVREYDASVLAAFQQKIAYLREHGFSWATIASIGAVAKGTAWNYGTGKTPPDAFFVERILSHNGERLMLTRPCPDCGLLHLAGRCHGEPGAVAWIKSGERVVKARAPRRYRDLYAMPVSVLAWKITHRKENR